MDQCEYLWLVAFGAVQLVIDRQEMLLRQRLRRSESDQESKLTKQRRATRAVEFMGDSDRL